MLKKLSVIFLSVILVIGVMPEKTMALLVSRDEAYFIIMDVSLDDRPDGTDIIGGFIAENTETGIKYEFVNTGELATTSGDGTTHIKYLVKNLPLGVYDIYAKDAVHGVCANNLDLNDLASASHSWGKITSSTMYTVNYRDGGNTLFTQYVQYSHNTSYVGDVPTKSGYKFDKWIADGGTSGNSWRVYNTLNIYANWTAEPTYTATLNVTLNGEKLTEGADEAAQDIGNLCLQDSAEPTRIISLKRESGLTYTAENVPNGRYNILRNGVSVKDTSIVLEINGADGEAELPFYSVHFMDEDTELSVSYEESGAGMPAPITPPSKVGCVFDKWTDSKDKGTEFDFSQNVTKQTFIYASYISNHIHDWSGEYRYDDDSHWHECNTPDCPIMDKSQKEGFGEHTYGEWTVTKQPTVSEYGEKERRCTVCGRKETESVEKLPEDGHTHSYTGKQEIIKEPSCTEEGIRRIYCALEDCGEYIEEKIEKTAHDYDTSEWKYDFEGHWYVCKNCGTAGEKTAHRMSGEPVITPPEGNTPGLKTWECEDCGYVKNEIIPVAPPEEKPTVPNEPENPSAPSEPEKPTVPGEPENPTTPSEPQKPPMTGDTARVQIYATLAMIAGMLYLILYFADSSVGMTEEEKNKLVSRLIGWAKGRGAIARYAALTAIFMLLLLYHSIGRRVEANLSEVRGK